MQPIRVEWVHLDKFKLLESRFYTLSDRKLIRIPKGYLTNFASVPKILRCFFDQSGRWNNATILHDYLYDNRIGTRKQADLEFLRCMRQDKVPRFDRNAYYRAVRLFGWLKWFDK